MHSLWVDPAKDMTNGSIFAAGIHALQNDQQLFSAVDKEALLEIAQPLVHDSQFFPGSSFFCRQVFSRVGTDFC